MTKLVEWGEVSRSRVLHEPLLMYNYMYTIYRNVIRLGTLILVNKDHVTALISSCMLLNVILSIIITNVIFEKLQLDMVYW